MDDRRSYLIVGLVLFLGFVGAIAFAFWLHQRHSVDDVNFYEIRFPGSVSGLSIGSAVKYKGITVGNVSHISLCEDAFDQVCVQAGVQKSFPLREGTKASLGMAGITGDAYVQLLGVVPTAPLLEGNAGHLPIISAEDSSFAKIVKTAPELLAHADILISKISDLFNDENRNAVSRVLSNLDRLTETFAANQANFTEIMGNLGQLTKEASGAMQGVQGNISATAFELKNFLQKFTETLGNVDVFLQSIDEKMEMLLPNTNERTYRLS